MHDESIIVRPLTPRNGVLVLSGYGIRVAVEKGHLIVADGRGRERREARFSRADRTFRRLVVLGHAGTVSLEALRWLRDVGCSFAQIGLDGDVIAAWSPPGSDDVRLRRAQARAATTRAGLDIARELIRRKLDGQATILEALERPGAGPAAAAIRRLRALLDACDTPRDVLWVEADAAAVYFDAWSGLPVTWVAKDADRVPEHWRAFTGRRSPISGTTRQAADPINGLLNFAYGALETAGVVTCRSVGLDPGMGILHTDLRFRNSLALDIMEPVRADVDRWVLDHLRTRTFAAREFFELPDGTCRLMPILTRAIAEAVPSWAATIATVATDVAGFLARSVEPSRRRGAPPSHGYQGEPPGGATPEPPGGSHVQRLRGPARVIPSENRDPARATARRVRPVDTSLPRGCLGCGVVLDPALRRSYCDDCRPERRTAGGLQSMANRRQRHADAVAEFTRDILPGLATVSLAQIAEAGNFSRSMASAVRRGKKIPAQRHWEALKRLAAVNRDDEV